MKFSTAALLLLLPTTSTSFQFPFLPSSFRSIHTNIFQPQDTTALSAKRRKEFTDDGSPRGFAPSSSSNKRGFDLNKNGQERNITSVKDVDAALNDEIEGALASAELDLMASAASAGGGNVVAGGDSTLEIKEEVPEVKMAKMPKKEEEEPQSQWDALKETLYDAADSLNKKMMKPPPSFAADFTPVPPETPGEKAMREWSAIDVDSISAGSVVDSLEEDVMSPEERMLLQAQREAEEAEAMLREAELESERIEKELSMFSYSTADAGGGGGEDSVVAAAIEKEGSLVNEEEEDALASMASAYQAALDAANDNVNLVTAQIEELEVELSSALQQMESAAEDKERVSAEYAYLASNYRSYKEKMDREGDVMRDEVQDYASRVASLEEEIGKLKGELTQAQEEVAKWKSDYESIQKEMAEQLQSSLMEQKELQATLDDVTSTFESTLEDSQKEYEATLAVVTSEYDEAISQSKKMIAALRQSLRNARSEAKSKALVEEDAVKAVDDVRAKMNDEVEKLRGALKGLEGQAGQNDAAISKEREEREKLLEEIE
jgi:predicted  nucleic acid-binding Zn-ribbon protein